MLFIKMQKYIDAHCHISDSTCLTEVGAIFNAAKPSDWATVSKISDKEKNIYGAIGVHPWYISDLSVGWQSELSDLLKQNPELMVGEIGLDKFHNDMSRQMDVFIAQLNIACALNRGVCVHCVGAYDKRMVAFQKSLCKFIPDLVCFLRCYLARTK